MKRSIQTIFASLSLGLLGIGCGDSSDEKTADAKGKLTSKGSDFSPQSRAGRPLPPGDPGVRIIFSRADGPKTGEEFGCSLDPAKGTFEALGAKGPGIPPGKYTVSVYLGAFVLGDAPSPKKPPSAPGGKLTSSEHSDYGTLVAKVEIDIPAAGKTDISIEIEEKKSK